MKPRVFLCCLTLLSCLIGCTDGHPGPAEIKGKPGLSQGDFESLLNEAGFRGEEARQKKDWDSYAQAIDLCRQAVLLEPQNVKGRLRLGNLHFEATDFFYQKKAKQEHYQAAKEQFRKAVALDPQSDEPYHDLARSHLALEEYKEAEANFKKALQANPKNTHAIIDLGILYYHLEKYPEAERYLFEYVKHADPAMENIHYIRATEFLGRVYLKLGKIEEAERILKDSVETYDQWLDMRGNTNYWGCPYQALGELYSKTGNKSKEHELILKAAELEVFRPHMQWEGALRSFQIGDYDRAQEFIERLLKLEDKADHHVMEGFILLALKRYDDAERLFHAQHQEPGSAVGLGHLHLVRREYPEAEEQFGRFLHSLRARSLPLRKWLQKKEGFLLEFDWVCYEMACLGMGWLHSNENQHEKAIADYDRILSVRPDHLLALVGKGNALSGLKRLDEAEAAFRQALAYFPDNKYAITELGIVKFNKGEYESAEADFKTALSQDDQNYTCPYEGMGLVYLQRGQTEEAKEFFKKAIEINPDIEYKKYNGLARIYLQEGRYEEAEALLQKSKANYPYDQEADALLEKLKGSR